MDHSWYLCNMHKKTHVTFETTKSTNFNKNESETFGNYQLRNSKNINILGRTTCPAKNPLINICPKKRGFQ